MEIRNPTEISKKCTRILSFWLKKTTDDSVTVDDQCDVLYENVDVDELSMDLVSVNGSFEESVASLMITREDYIQLQQSDESQLCVNVSL